MSSSAPAAPPSAAEAAGLVEFLNASPTAFHAVAESVRRLRAAGFTELSERQPWRVAPGGRYFFTRNASTLVAFAVGRRAAPGAGFVVVGAHTDSPCPKLKPVSKSPPRAGCHTVAVEPYGGGLWYTWFDRDWSVAGRAIVRRGDAFCHQLVRIDRRARGRPLASRAAAA